MQIISYFKTDKSELACLADSHAAQFVSLAPLYATLIVKLNTPGKPPTLLAIIGIVLLIIGYIFNQKSLK